MIGLSSGQECYLRSRLACTTIQRQLKVPRRNPHTHSKKQFQQIANSMLQFGWTAPIVADEHGYIVAGVGRHQASKLLGLHAVPVITVSGLSEAEKRALALADNKIAENAGWNRIDLAAELGELAELLPECNLDLWITGFDPSEIDGLLGDLGDREADPADEIPQLSRDPVSRLGDSWLLDGHRLYCGDAHQGCRRPEADG